MPNIFFLLLALILMNSCQSKKEVPLPLNKPEIKTVEVVNKDCDILGFSNPEPMAIWKMDNGKELVVCKQNEAYKTNEGEFSGWINIYEKKGSSLTPFISEVNSELPSEFYSFKIKKNDGTKILIQRLVRSSMEEAGGSSSVATEAFLECGKDGCKLTPEKCINNATYKIDKEAVQNLLDIRFKKKPAKDFGYFDVLIGKVVHAALAGDKKALLALYGDGTDNNSLNADGAAAETLSDGMYIIEQFIKLGCIKK